MTTALTEPGTGSGATDARRWWALAVLASVQFMIVANITVVNVALPSVQADLHLTGAGLAWAVNAYLLAAGGVLLLGGRLGDLLGRGRVLGWGTALFAAASLAAGAAQDATTLVASRFAQGLGWRWPPRRRSPWSRSCSRAAGSGRGRWGSGAGWARSAPWPGCCCRGCSPAW
jgi:MFS family permease